MAKRSHIDRNDVAPPATRSSKARNSKGETRGGARDEAKPNRVPLPRPISFRRFLSSPSPWIRGGEEGRKGRRKGGQR